MWPAMLLLVFILSLFGGSLLGDSWFWAFGNSLGLLAFAFLLILAINGRARLGRSEEHRWLGIALVVTLIGHCLWFLIGDSITLEYIQFGAPHYMVAGLLSAGLLILLSLSSLLSYRNKGYSTYSAFRRWHKWLSILIIITALFHILLSGLYFTYYWQGFLLLMTSLTAYLAPKYLNLDYSFQRRNLAVAAITAAALFVLIRAYWTA